MIISKLDTKLLSVNINVSLTEPLNCNRLKFFDIPIINFYVIFTIYYQSTKIGCWYIKL